MEAKLQSLKVPELKELLQNASLPTNGNKPDLIKRLLEHSSATASLQPKQEAAPTDAPAGAPQPTAPTASAAGDAPKQSAPEASSDVNAEASAANTGAPSQETRTQAHLAELEKRRARAVRFGQPSEDLEKEIARVKKFGLAMDAADASQRVDGGLRAGKRAYTQEAKAAKQAKTESSASTPAISVRGMLTQEEELARRQRRAERFGLVDAVEEEKKRSRAERFGVRTARAPDPQVAP